MNTFIGVLNKTGETFFQHGLTMLLQFGLLACLLFLVDMAIRKRAKASLRYCLWCLLLVKLVLPTTLSLPTGIGYLTGVDFSVNLTQTNQAQPLIQTAYAPTTLMPAQTASEPARPISSQQDVIESRAFNVADAPASVETTALNWQGCVFIVWIAGAVLLLAGFIRRIASIKKLIAESEAAPERLIDMVRVCREKIGVRGEVELRLSNSMASPAVCGLFRHVILVPIGLLEKMDRSKLTMVLMHELGHVKRADIWINFVQTILQIFYFYNPFVWAANAYIRRVREQAVDEMVLTRLNCEAASYSNTLIDIAEKAFLQPRLGMATVSIIESKSKLKERIKIMLGKPIPKNTKIGFAGLLLLIAVAAVLLPMAKAVPPLEFVIKGTVSDAQTGKPIAGAKVGDVERYADGKYGTVTDSNGNYSYKTWYEEHDIKCEASGYKTESKVLLTKVLGSEQEKILDFALGGKMNSGDGFKATLQNGAKVELVGICEHPTEGKKWWAPDGSILEAAPFDSIGVSISPMPGRSAYEMAVQISGAKDIGFRYAIKGTENSGSGDVKKEGGQVENLYGIVFDQSKKQTSFNLRVGIAASAWETVAKQKADFQGVYSYKETTWHGPVQQDGHTILNISHTLIEQNVRVIAIDKQGKQHTGGSNSARQKEVESIQTAFSLSLSDIEEFQLQTRPYEWVEFKNVSLRPGVKTDAEVAVEEPTQQAGNAEKTAAKTAVVSPAYVQKNTDVNIAGTIEGMTFGVIKNKYGSAMWGNKIQYTPGLYLGSLISGDKIELTDKNVVEDEFGIPVIQVKNLEQNGSTPANSIGWVHINDTSFVDNFIANPKWLGKPKKLLTPEKMREIETLRKSYEENIEKATPNTINSMSMGNGIDVAVEKFEIRPYPEGGLYTLIVTVRNNGTVESPKFDVYFYRNDPSHLQPMKNQGGPLKDGETQGEACLPIALKEGINELSVIIDPDNKIAESNEMNNEASMKVVVKDGKIVEKIVSL
jgi:beta-lactamase regulating signal transducer with metallopeptidase domain